MESNVVEEGEAEIWSFPPKRCGQDKNPTLRRASSPSESKNDAMEPTNSETDESSSRFHVDGNRALVPPASRVSTPGYVIRHASEERSHEQSMEDAERKESSVSVTGLPMKQVQIPGIKSSRDASATNTDENELSERTDASDSGNYDFIEQGGRFSVPPPKYSNLYSISLDHEGVPSSGLLFEEQKEVHTSSRHSSTPEQISDKDNTTTFSSSQQGGEDLNDRNIATIGSLIGDDEQSDIILHNLGTQDDDDSILDILEEDKPTEIVEKFNNEELYSNKNFKSRRRSRQRRKQQILESLNTDDEMSIENYGAQSASQSTGLQERTHQAWQSRQRKNITARLKNDSKLESEKSSNVSFGVPDTIHHFDPGVQERYQYDNEDPEDASLDRSLNSEYTKTLESEVEDMIKDILFIGNPKKSKPGRKKYRYKSSTERKQNKNLRSRTKMDDGGTEVAKNDRLTIIGKIEDDTSTLSMLDEKHEVVNDSKRSTAEQRRVSRSKYVSSAYGDDTCSADSTVSSVDSNTVETFQSERDGTEDPLNAMIGLVEGGLSVMTSAIGYALGDHPATEAREDNFKNCRKSNSDFDIFEACGIHLHNEKLGSAPNSRTFTRTTNALSKSALIDHASGVVPVSPTNPAPYSERARRIPEVHKDHEDYKVLVKGNRNKPDRQTMDLVNGPELIELAMHAARSVHKLQGVDYDESIPIDLYKEVKKCHVTLALPLGIIFLENDGGCFVTKVSPDGSAAKSRKVLVGDQLASINGASGSKMKVDDICDAVGRSSHQGQIDLIFLRYVGPFRPCTIRRSDEGHKGIDNTILYKHRVANTARTKKPTKKMTGFRLFGRGKKNDIKNNENVGG